MSEPTPPPACPDGGSPTPSGTLHGIANALQGAGRGMLFGLKILHSLTRSPYYGTEIIDATARVGQHTILPVMIVMAPFGMVVALHGSEVFTLFGAQRLLGFLVGLTTLRELAPNLVAVLLAAQAGSAAAAELATMRIQEELDATLVMGVDPLKLHVVPRFLGIVLAAPLLTVLGSAAGLLGAYVLAVLVGGQDGGAYQASLYGGLSLFDVWSSMLKATVFGAIVGGVACYLGYHASGGARGVGEAVNNTVVYSITLFLLMNYFLSSALFGIVD